MLRIRLKDIPTEGQSFKITSDDPELRGKLQDLIGMKKFIAECRITPLQSGTFELRGQFKTEVPEQCSRCGEDFCFQLSEPFRELMMPKTPLPRDGKMSRVNHISDLQEETPSVVEYEDDVFDWGEYLHQCVALAIPGQPAPEVDNTGSCVVCHISVKQHSFNYDEDFDRPESPFSVLKQLKLN